ncbi:MAG: hypothetical protein U1F77_10205 [Kiritimatiellia bacterium]
MSFKVLVIPEDPTNNGYILKPLVQAILDDAGRPQARVDVLSNPRLMGYNHAVKAIREDLPDRYGFWDLWIFLPDADRASATAMEQLEAYLHGKGVNLLCCPARPEVEIYACAAYRSEIPEGWNSAREDLRMKENVFEPLLKRYGDSRRVGAGRDLMIESSLRNLPLLLELCPELRTLRDRIASLLAQR